MAQGREINLEEAARIFGFSRRGVEEWLTGGCPARKEGKQWRLNTAEVVAWLREREKRLVLGEVGNIDEAQAKRRKLAAEAAMAELELASRQGQVVAVADFEARMSAMIGAARAKLLPMGAKLGPMVAVEDDPAICESLIDSAVGEALSELSNGLPDDTNRGGESGNGGAEGSADLGTPPGSDSQRVGGRRKTPIERKRG